MQDFPPELVSEIFAQCLPARDSDRMSTSHAPMVLCAVSSEWRQIALSEPQLWDIIIFPAPYEGLGDDVDDPNWLRFIDAGGIERWFGRTGPTRLLSLGVEGYLSEVANERYMPSIQEVVFKVGPSRFRNLELVFAYHLHTPSIPAFFPCRRGLPSRFAELRSLAITSFRTQFDHLDTSLPDREEAHEPIHTAFSLSPKLEEIKLTFSATQGRFRDAIDFIRPFAQQLTVLEIDANLERGIKYISLMDWKTTFQLCTNLTEARMTAPRNCDSWHSVNPYEIVTSTTPCPNLTSLTIYVDTNGYTTWKILQEPVVFSNLKNLHLRFRMRWHGSQRQNELIRQLRFLSRTLETLKVSVSDALGAFLPEQITELVKALIKQPRALPRLTHFAFPFPNSDLVNDIGRLLRLHEPKRKYPGLKAHVTVLFLKGPDEEYQGGRLEDDPLIGGRYSLERKVEQERIRDEKIREEEERECSEGEESDKRENGADNVDDEDNGFGINMLWVEDSD